MCIEVYIYGQEAVMKSLGNNNRKRVMLMINIRKKLPDTRSMSWIERKVSGRKIASIAGLQMLLPELVQMFMQYCNG